MKGPGKSTGDIKTSYFEQAIKLAMQYKPNKPLWKKCKIVKPEINLMKGFNFFYTR